MMGANKCSLAGQRTAEVNTTFQLDTESTLARSLDFNLLQPATTRYVVSGLKYASNHWITSVELAEFVAVTIKVAAKAKIVLGVPEILLSEDLLSNLQVVQVKQHSWRRAHHFLNSIRLTGTADPAHQSLDNSQRRIDSVTLTR